MWVLDCYVDIAPFSDALGAFRLDGDGLGGVGYEDVVIRVRFASLEERGVVSAQLLGETDVIGNNVMLVSD